MCNSIENKFKRFIIPYLKESGLILEDGISIGDTYRVDYVVKSESGYYTHIFEVKDSFSTDALDQLNRYHAVSYVGTDNKQVPIILACYNGGNWEFYDMNHSKIPVNTLFTQYVVTKKRDSNKVLIPKVISYIVALVLMTICALELFPSLCPCIVPISREVAFLLCASGVFAISPMFVSRIKEIHVEPCRLVIVLNEKHKE